MLLLDCHSCVGQNCGRPQQHWHHDACGMVCCFVVLPRFVPAISTTHIIGIYAICVSWLLHIYDDRFYIALVSALEQAHCTFVTCDSKRVTIAFYSMFWISTEVVYYSTVWLLHGLCHVKLLPSWCILCTPYHHAQPRHFMQSHWYRDMLKRIICPFQLSFVIMSQLLQACGYMSELFKFG